MSSNDDSDAPLANVLLTKHTKSGRLSQMPQSRRPEGAPLLQCWAPSLVVILPSLKTVRCKARSEEDDLADLAIAFKKQRQSAAATGVASNALWPSDAQAGTGEDAPNVKARARALMTMVYNNKQRVCHAPVTEGPSSESSSDRNKDETRDEDTLSTGDSVPLTLQFAIKSDLSITR
ncbi:hypothetical protein ARMGADRAFT_1081910 [Armillaria gallica]|uniref:Uncharacterized protein n=1 Tax=Armillaria gallica TaxID=47427 RepID=A0A2H3DSA4_ARMGA|nr:hypothetical protein ARMGADRAFT_1081910 [Armillaria gallica]